MLKVFIVNDSPVLTAVMGEMVKTEPGFTVMGSAASGDQALQILNPPNTPDIILMDIHMPGLNGVETTERLVKRFPKVRVLITTATVTRNQRYVFEALSVGARDFVRSPSLSQPPGTKITQNALREAGKDFLHKLRVLAAIGQSGPVPPTPSPHRDASPAPPFPAPRDRGKGAPGEAAGGRLWIGIGSSTGGPTTLAMLLSYLPRPFPAPIIICQHISPGFEDGMADWLTRETGFETTVVRRRTSPKDNHVYLCPGGRDLIVTSGTSIATADPLQGYSFRPNINRFYESLAKYAGKRSCAVQLTGMGADGAEGIVAVRDVGGLPLVQSAETAVISSMPDAARRALGSVQPKNIEAIAHSLTRAIRGDGQ